MTPYGRVILDGSAPGGFNMRGDELLAEEVADGEYPIVVRFYTWAPSAVSLGKNQSPEVIVASECERRGWDVVYRPTGGRALLHHHDLSYSVCIPAGEDRLERLKWLYHTTALCFRDALNSLGMVAEMVSSVGEGVGGGVRSGARLCLNTHTRGELAVEGKKIVASAQRLYDRSILQHGSINLTGDCGAIAGVAPVSEDERERLADKLRRSAANVANASGRDIRAEEIVSRAIEPFERRFGITLKPVGWLPEEIGRIHAKRERFEIKPVMAV